MTGAPETYKGEAVELEASNVVSGFASIAFTSVSGKGPDPNDTDGEHEKDKDGGGLDNLLPVPDPGTLVLGANEAKGKADGGKTGDVHDKTKVPVQDAMWAKTRPVMRTLGDVADAWERWGK